MRKLFFFTTLKKGCFGDLLLSDCSEGWHTALDVNEEFGAWEGLIHKAHRTEEGSMASTTDTLTSLFSALTVKNSKVAEVENNHPVPKVYWHVNVFALWFSTSGLSNNRCRNIIFLFQHTTTCTHTQQHCKSSPVKGRIFPHWSNHKARAPERMTSSVTVLLTGPPIPSESPPPKKSLHHSQKAQGTFLMSQLFFSETIVQSF